MSLTKKLVLAFAGVLHHTVVKHAEEQVGTRLEDSVIHAGKSVDEFMFSPRDFHVCFHLKYKIALFSTRPLRATKTETREDAVKVGDRITYYLINCPGGR